MEFLTIDLKRQEFHIEFLTIDLRRQEFHMEFLTIDLERQEFHIEILTINFKRQEFHMEILTIDLRCKNSTWKFTVISIKIYPFRYAKHYILLFYCDFARRSMHISRRDGILSRTHYFPPNSGLWRHLFALLPFQGNIIVVVVRIARHIFHHLDEWWKVHGLLFGNTFRL